MITLKKTAAGTVLGGALLVGGGLGLAHAAPPAPQAQTEGDGLVSVTVTAGNQRIGVIEDVSVANAVTLAGTVCPMAGIDSTALTDLDVSGTAVTNPCTSMAGLSFSFAQNTQAGQGRGAETAPGQNDQRGSSTDAPGQNRDTSAVPSTPPGQR